jgi:hypothetical protein
MKRISSIGVICLAAIAVVGCSGRPNGDGKAQGGGDPEAKAGITTYTGEDGTKTTVVTDGKGHSTVTDVDKKGKTTTFETKSRIDPIELGVEVYPGSKEIEGPGGSSRIDTPKAVQINAGFTTKDNPEAVARFYLGRVKSASKIGGGDSAMVSGRNDSGDDLIVAIKADERKGITEIRLIVTKVKK